MITSAKTIPTTIASKARPLPADPPASGESPRAESKRARAVSTANLSGDERSTMVAQAAYFRAERRGFTPGHELEDWVAAEQEVDRLLGAAAAP